MNSYEKLKLISNHKTICLIAHSSPDADALASMVVFANFLKKTFNLKSIDIFAECSKPPANCQTILNNLNLNPNPIKYDVAIMMDSPNITRLGEYSHLFEQAQLKIVIDHHQTNLFQGDINIVEQRSSTCEIVYSILKHFNHILTKSDMEKIYAGIITDTNNFTVGNFNKKTFLIVSEIIEHINHDALYNQFFSNNTLKNMQLLSLAIRNIKTFNNGKIIISHVTKTEAKELSANFDDFIGIINRLATINNSLLICLIYPKGKQYYVSMRARNGLSVSQIAKENNGGGHNGAAAFLSDLKLDEIEKYIITSFIKIMETKNYL